MKAITLVLLALLVAMPATAAPRTFTYSVAARGASPELIGAFAAKIERVYADPRGWSLDEQVAFRRVAAGGDFTIWLVAPTRMASFGGDCNASWNCRAGRDVVINESRWQTGSPYWHGALDDYRSMIVNHETGHWLGLDHDACAVAGSPAPIMMQQSKGTGACSPNAWPLAKERRAVAQLLGLTQTR